MILFDPNDIVSIAKIQLGKNVHTLQSSQQIWYDGQWVLVSHHHSIKVFVVMDCPQGKLFVRVCKDAEAVNFEEPFCRLEYKHRFKIDSSLTDTESCRLDLSF